MQIRKLIQGLSSAAAVMLFASTATAALMITTSNVESVITFDADTPGMFNYKTGTGVANIPQENLSYGVADGNPNQNSALLTIGAASMSKNFEFYLGNGAGSSSHFGNDGNGKDDYQVTATWPNDDNGKVGDPNMTPQFAATTGLSSDTLRLSAEDDYVTEAFFFRIQNATGQTITDWNFGAKYYYGENGLNPNYSHLTFSYAIDNGVNPDAMTFTDFGSAAAITGAATLTDLAGTLNQTVVTSGVADGGYLVLAFRDTQAIKGSTILLDDIGITAVVPEPATMAVLLGAVALLLVGIRRRR